MEAYFKQVDEYVELAESKVREYLRAFTKIGLTREEIVKKDFFKSLGSATKGKDAFEDYFNLVDYYVATATKVIEFLRNHLESQTTLLRKKKEELGKQILRDIGILKGMKTNEDPLKLLDTLIRTLYNEKINVKGILSYVNGTDLNYELNKTLDDDWKQRYNHVKTFLDGKQIMKDYGEMRKKFIKFKHLSIENIPLDKQDQFALAIKLFEQYPSRAQLIAKTVILGNIHEDVINLFKHHRRGTADIINYLQGGVSQAFLILRNTNDVDRSYHKEENKLLMETGSSLVYVDQGANVLGTTTNEFKKIFHGRPEEQSQINHSILSPENFALLEKGGNVIIIAYGQSGTGKTYNLTKLIEYFASLSNFTIDGISSVQFYNDVMLPNSIKRLTVPFIKDDQLPREAAERAVYRTGQLQGLTKMDTMYDSTKMYDVIKLADQNLKLKIEPVVTPMPQLPNKKLKEIQTYSNACFAAATKVNELATSDPNLNQLLERYKQIIIDDQTQRRDETIRSAYAKFCNNEFFLPLYEQLTAPEFNSCTMSEAASENYICSKYGISSFAERKFKLSEVDLETLLHSFLQPDLLKKLEEACAICVQRNAKLSDDVPKLIKNFNEFIMMRRMVFVMCDAEPVTKKGDKYQVSTYSFQNAALVQTADDEKKGPYKLVIGYVDDDKIDMQGFETVVDLDPVKDKNNKYDVRHPERGQAYRLIFTKYIRNWKDPTKEGWHYRILERADINSYFVFLKGGFVQHLRDKDTKLDDKVNKLLFFEYLSKYDKLPASAKEILIQIDPADTRMLNQLYLRHILHQTTEVENDFPPEETTDWIVPGTLYNGSASMRFYLERGQKKPNQIKKMDCPTEDYTFDLWKTDNTFTYEVIAARPKDEWTTDPAAYCAKFEHCVQISKTGPDNASNYSLFDHAELRYKNYFKDDQTKIQPAYTADYNSVTVKTFSDRRANLVKHYDGINAARFTRAMPQNPESSRSQLATTLHLSKKGVPSKLVFIDLAGNERVDTTKKHIVTCESVYINSTLQFVTDMFLRMKEEYPGWTVNSDGDEMSYTELSTNKTQTEPPTQDQLVPFKPPAEADPFQRYLHSITTESPILKPAIVMVVCAYEYYSSWVPPNPSHEVSKESLHKTFGFITALFSFGKPLAITNDDDVLGSDDAEVDTRTGGTRRRAHRTRGRRKTKRGKRRTKKGKRRTRFLNKR